MTREFSRNIKSKGIIISETTSWGWHGIKQPSGKHNTINILLTRGARVLGEYSVEVAVQTVNLLLSGSGGSTPSLATAPVCRLWKIDGTCLCSLLQIILWVQILLGQLCGACSNHLDITVNYENQKHHEKIYGTLTAIYFLNKILGEYFIIYFIFCVLKGEKHGFCKCNERRKQVYKN